MQRRTMALCSNSCEGEKIFTAGTCSVERRNTDYFERKEEELSGLTLVMAIAYGPLRRLYLRMLRLQGWWD